LRKQGALTVILPVYNEEAGIFKNTMKIKAVLEEQEITHEFILVDDGSTDQTWEEVHQLTQHVKLQALRFSRNFGKECAIMAAMDHVRTDVCVVMDADLQHPPEKIVDMFRMWDQEGYEIIDGIKKERGKEGVMNRLGAMAFYQFFSRATGLELDKATDFKLLDAKVIEALKNLPERETFFRGLSTWVGFKRGKMEFSIQQRKEGKSRWSLAKLFRLGLGAITSFTSIPLHIVTMTGVLFLMGSMILGIQTLYMKFSGNAVSGFTTVILLLLIIGSALMLSLGMIGVYIEKIYNEIKRRPRYIVSEKMEGNP
jgi:polyisoprenyl-phosphate glycosyltransferase